MQPSRKQDYTGQEHYTNAPAIDWLTCTTFGEDDYRTLRGLAYSLTGGKTSEGNYLQYAGEQDRGYFAGVAQQNGRPHYLVRASGALAHELAMLTHEYRGTFPRARATRLDVQVTVPVGTGPRLADIALKLERGELGKYPGRGRPPKLTTIRGENEKDTIYIGSRESERFLRIYAKEVAGENYLRFEVEYKGQQARKAWAGVLKEGYKVLPRYIRGELAALPAGLRKHLHEVERCAQDATPERLRTIHEPPGWQRQLAWVKNQVAPTLEELAVSPAREELKKVLLHALYGEAGYRIACNGRDDTLV